MLAYGMQLWQVPNFIWVNIPIVWRVYFYSGGKVPWIWRDPLLGLAGIPGQSQSSEGKWVRAHSGQNPWENWGGVTPVSAWFIYDQHPLVSLVFWQKEQRVMKRGEVVWALMVVCLLNWGDCIVIMFSSFRGDLLAISLYKTVKS
jgi:hypothetical protein